MRKSTAIRAIAWAVVGVGIAAPLVRRRIRLPAAAVLGAAGAAPVALCVATPRSRARDVATCCLQMWAYLNAYEMPHDDPDALRARVRIDYPIAADRLLGLGTIPTVRLQRRFAHPGRIRSYEKVLAWAHWTWFAVPHSAVAYTLLRRPDRFPRSAALTYAVFDVGVIAYWALPTAPPWYAAEQGRMDTPGEASRTSRPRRMMIEYGEQFWQHRWGALYDSLGGNPLAAMPSLHFATSVMAAHLLGEHGRVEAALGWTYALTLGFALVYLGEHYVIDLLAGLALTEGVRIAAPHAEPLFARASGAVQALEAWARP